MTWRIPFAPSRFEIRIPCSSSPATRNYDSNPSPPSPTHQPRSSPPPDSSVCVIYRLYQSNGWPAPSSPRRIVNPESNLSKTILVAGRGSEHVTLERRPATVDNLTEGKIGGSSNPALLVFFNRPSASRASLHHTSPAPFSTTYQELAAFCLS
jgi:hypothetical protein